MGEEGAKRFLPSVLHCTVSGSLAKCLTTHVSEGAHVSLHPPLLWTYCSMIWQSWLVVGNWRMTKIRGGIFVKPKFLLYCMSCGRLWEISFAPYVAPYVAPYITKKKQLSHKMQTLKCVQNVFEKNDNITLNRRVSALQ